MQLGLPLEPVERPLADQCVLEFQRHKQKGTWFSLAKGGTVLLHTGKSTKPSAIAISQIFGGLSTPPAAEYKTDANDAHASYFLRHNLAPCGRTRRKINHL